MTYFKIIKIFNSKKIENVLTTFCELQKVLFFIFNATI